jgi:hypothetical protein
VVFHPFTYQYTIQSGNLSFNFPYAVIMAGVGLESLLTLNIIDEITETGNKEAIAQVAQIFYRVFLVWVAALCWDKALLMFLMVQEQDFQNCCSHCFVMFGAGLIEVLPMAALLD